MSEGEPMRFGLVDYRTGGRHFHAMFMVTAKGVELSGVVARAWNDFSCPAACTKRSDLCEPDRDGRGRWD